MLYVAALPLDGVPAPVRPATAANLDHYVGGPVPVLERWRFADSGLNFVPSNAKASPVPAAPLTPISC